ncbi:MAG: DUF4190 domain-containing protein [Acidimicrobiales bacterium]
MSEQSHGPGWWLASDGRWYPPEAAPPTAAPPPSGPWGPPAAPSVPGPSAAGMGGLGWGAPPPGYGYAYGPSGPAWGPPSRPSANGLCVASLILGIVSFPLLCVWAVGAVTAIVGLALGIVALRRMNRGEVSEEGRGMAIGGIVCSAIALALVVVVVVLVILAASTDDALGLVGGVPS